MKAKRLTLPEVVMVDGEVTEIDSGWLLVDYGDMVRLSRGSVSTRPKWLENPSEAAVGENANRAPYGES